jgi:hypothetical protein
MLSIVISINTSLYRKKHDSDWYAKWMRSEITAVLQNNQYEIIPNIAPSSKISSYAIYYKTSACHDKYILIPVSINLEAEGYLSRIVPASYKIKYIFYDYESEKKNKIKFILMYLKHLIYNKLGYSKIWPSKTALVLATPPGCKASQIDWNPIWNANVSEISK